MGMTAIPDSHHLGNRSPKPVPLPRHGLNELRPDGFAEVVDGDVDEFGGDGVVVAFGGADDLLLCFCNPGF